MTNLLQQTPAQTVGPYFAYGLTAQQYGYDFSQLADGTIARETTPGTRITLTGRVLDGAGAPITDALVEIWQADSTGSYPGADAFADADAFHGFGRAGTGMGKDGQFRFSSIKPGGADGRAPHLNVCLQMRGMLLHAYTFVYFDDEATANTADPVLALVPEGRRGTLIARGDGRGNYVFDILMQGDFETVFFDL